MQEDSYFIGVGRCVGGVSRGLVMGDGQSEDRAKETFLVASVEEAVEERVDLVIDDLVVGVQAVKPVDHSENEASKDARRVGAMRREIHVEVERLFVESVGNSAVLDCQLKVEEDGGVRALGDFPAELAEFIEVFLKTLPHSAVEIFVGAVPDSEDIIDVSLVEPKETAILAENAFFLMDAEVQGSVHWGWGSTHGSAGELEPACVAELEEVVSHDDVECCHNCLVVWGQWEIVPDDGHGMIGIDVCVHRNGVGGKESSAVRKIG